jgi:hypothetical protein
MFITAAKMRKILLASSKNRENFWISAIILEIQGPESLVRASITCKNAF